MVKTYFTRVGTLFLAIVIAASLSLSAGLPLFTNDAQSPVENLQGEPIIRPLAPIGEEPNVWIDDGDFVISYDEPGLNDSLNPAIAVAPPGSPWAGSIHTVWSELSNGGGANPFSEIHYSKSEAGQKGLEWSNDEASEGDREISAWAETAPFVSGDAMYPSIAIDMMGWIHVVWSQSYPDGTYEIHYSRSEDNGKTWSGFDGTGDTLVSFRQVVGQNGFWVDPPKIVISNQPSTILHVVWSEVGSGGEGTEVKYSQSFDQGITWTADQGAPQVISSLSSPEPAYAADIAVGGTNEEFLHVVWQQDSPVAGTSEVFYTRSADYGNPGTWEPEKPISFDVPDGAFVGRARVAAFDRYAHAIWDQSGPSGGREVYYSGSDDDGLSWSGRSMDNPISFPDGNDVWNPVVTTSPVNGGMEAYVIWTEVDETSPKFSQEIHYSMSEYALDPFTWTGLNQDNVLSWPDPTAQANADNPAIDFGMVNNQWSPQIVWQEINEGWWTTGYPGDETIMAPPGDGSIAPEHSSEIHYIPQTTFNFSVGTGWNFISVPLVQNVPTILTVLNDGWGDAGTTWDRVMWYDASDITQTISVTNELVFGPAVGGETGPFNLAYTTINDISLYNDMEGLWIIGEDYTFDWTTGAIDISAGATYLNAGESLIAFYNYTKPGDSWKSYDKNRPGAFNDLLLIDRRIGFWINIITPGDGNLTFAGDLPTSTNIQLYAGWNLIGYPAQNDTVYDVLNLKTDTGATEVAGFDAPSPYDVKTLADSYVLKNGEAYWVKMSSGFTWTVNW